MPFRWRMDLRKGRRFDGRECAIVGKAGKKVDRCDDDGDEWAQNEKTCVRFFLSFALVVDAVIVKGPTFFPLWRGLSYKGDLSWIRSFDDGKK